MVEIGLGILVVILVVLVAILICLQRRRRKIKYDNQEISAPNSEHAGQDFVTLECVQYELATLEAATNQFSDDNKLGEGGFGRVYKGTLADGQEIAVKRLFKDSKQGEEQFKNEVVFIAKLQQKYLVRLLGFCSEADERLLVYEFVPNKSLDLILFDPERRGQLDWSKRYNIIRSIARGMVYLHEDSRLKIVHRDLKASNILLDADMAPKICDFGIARNFGVNQTRALTERHAGTLGYMAPEYLECGEYSPKSDVYSFGVLVLEIVSGMKTTSRQAGFAENLLTYAWKHWSADTPSAFVDASLGDSYSRSEVMRCMHLGLLCVQVDKDERPTMLSIVSWLHSNADIFRKPQRPSFFMTSTKKGSSSGTQETQFDQSTKTTSNSRNTEPQSNKSMSRSTSSFSGIEARTF